MKRILMLLLAAALTSVSASGQIDRQLPAYEALRTVGRDKGETWLGLLVEMRAVDGDPQPARWLLTFRDENARGGVREFAVTAQGVVSERTPVRGTDATAATVMSARGLNLDSTGAFTAANKQAAQAKVGFQSLDYLLQNQNGASVWIVRLFDTSRTEVGKVEISAQDGAVVSALRKPVDPTAAATASASPESSAPADSAARSLSERWVEGGGLVGHSQRWGERTWEATTNTAMRVGDSIGAFFTGRPPQQTAPGN